MNARSTLLCIVLCAASACATVTEEFSETHSEPIVVVNTEYTPAQKTTTVGYGLKMNGKMGMKLVTKTTPEKHIVVIRFQGTDVSLDSPELYQQARNLVGREAVVTYQKRYRVTYKHDEVTNRTFLGHRFLRISPPEQALSVRT